ncbi:MAG TPA: glycosyl hydrolase, partial [Luteolibacter sp.]|nr:glycosyl hydrolase [Luteolibacter sp.]
MRIMTGCQLLGVSMVLACGTLPLLGQSLEQGFADPPVECRPGAFWCWLNGSMTREQITRDLEEMKAKGMRGAEIWDVKAHRDPNRFVPTGPEFLGEESLELIAHAIREGSRLGLQLGMVASSGWNAGGSWVPPKYAGKELVWSVTPVDGSKTVDLVLDFPKCPNAPKGADGLPAYYRDIAVVAVPELKTLPSTAEVIDLTQRMEANGRLRWDAPPGQWRVLRFVCTNNGQQLIVPSPNSGGPMIDFVDPEATEFHVRHIADGILGKLGRKDFRGTAFQYMEFDSMELAHGVLWSGEFAKRFEERRGYSPIPYLPLFAGWSLTDAQADGRFRADYKLTVSDQLIHSHYVTGSKVLAQYGLYLVAEAGGPGPPIWDSCPVDAIKALGAVDVPRGEFWMKMERNIFLVKEISSAAHVYGKPLVDAEAFTTWRRWIDGPVTHKSLADRALCDGLNHFTLHTFASSPPEAGLPGRAYHAGTDLNVTSTLWPKIRPFMDYLSRCSYMQRQGRFVADVVYFYGAGAPNFYPAHMNAPCKIVPDELGLGHDYDVCDAQALITRMSVKEGRLVMPDGMNYALLALREQETMPLEVLRKIHQLVQDGATVVGPPPSALSGLK